MFGLIPWRAKENEGALAPRTEDPFRRMRAEFDELFDRFFAGWPAPLSEEGWGRGWGLEVKEEGKDVFVKADAPGFEAGDFDVQVSGDVLTIKAERKEGDGNNVERRLFRSLTLPAGVLADEVDARYRNGVLELRFPRSEEVVGKRIEVKA
jgi:HSP20 family protein